MGLIRLLSVTYSEPRTVLVNTEHIVFCDRLTSQDFTYVTLSDNTVLKVDETLSAIELKGGYVDE